MPQGYEVWTDQNPPPGDSPLNQSGYLWEHPTAGRLFYNPKTKQHVQVSDEAWEKYSAKPETAEDQTGALGGGVTVEETAGPVAGLRENVHQRAERLAREKTAKAVAAADAQKRAAAAGPMGGLSLTERAAATKLMQTEGLDEEEAAERIKALRANAEEQAEALSPE